MMGVVGPEGQFGPWVVERPIGRGGMATVYRSHHVDLVDRVVALKVLHESGLPDGVSKRMLRFAREVRLLRRLDHPGIVRVLDSGQHPSPWIALALVPGKPLHQAHPGPLSADAVLDLGVQLADALVHAHRVGVFHRDVKPSNILVDPHHRAWLVDFGIAMAIDESPITDSNRLAPGTLAYAPPEWFHPHRPTAPGLGDGYGLGVVLWEMLNGAPAFVEQGRAPSFADMFRLKSDLACLDPGDRAPPALADVIRGLTAGDMAERLPLGRSPRADGPVPVLHRGGSRRLRPRGPPDARAPRHLRRAGRRAAAGPGSAGGRGPPADPGGTRGYRQEPPGPAAGRDPARGRIGVLRSVGGRRPRRGAAGPRAGPRRAPGRRRRLRSAQPRPGGRGAGSS